MPNILTCASLSHYQQSQFRVQSPLTVSTGLSRWRRDPALPTPRTEITRFPHAVLEVRFCLLFMQLSERFCARVIVVQNLRGEALCGEKNQSFSFAL